MYRLYQKDRRKQEGEGEHDNTGLTWDSKATERQRRREIHKGETLFTA